MFGDEVSFISKKKEETSDTHNGQIDKEVQKILDESFDRVSKLLTEKDKELRMQAIKIKELIYAGTDTHREKIIKNDYKLL